MTLFKTRKFRTKFYAAQMILALEYLHRKNIIYLDLKPQNVLIDKHGYIRLVDFGLSIMDYLKHNNSTFMIMGTPEYLAPEVLNKEKVGPEVDWWCLGTIMYELLTGRPPFYEADETKEELFTKIRTVSPKWNIPVSPPLKDLITQLLDKNRHTRLGSAKGASEIRQHPWLANVQWNKLLNKTHKAPFVPTLKSDEDVQWFEKEFTQNQAISPQDYQMAASSGSNKSYQGFSCDYENNGERSVRSRSPQSPMNASPPEYSPQFVLGIKQLQKLQ